MPRMPRVHLNGVLYYVTQQGAHDRSLFRDADDNQAYLDLLTQYKTKHQFHLFSYALLSDKVNLIIEPYGSATISEIMRDLTSRYSKYYNGRYGANGPLFKGRFRTVLVEKETYLPRLVRYVNHLGIQAESFASSRSAYVQLAQGEKVTGVLADEMKNISVMPQFSDKANLNQLSMALPEIEISSMNQQMKEAVMGSPSFIQKIRTEMKEAMAQSQDAQPDAQAVQVPAIVAPWNFAYAGMRGKVWFAAFWVIPVLAVAAAFAVIPKVILPGSNKAEVQLPATTTQNQPTEDLNTLHASVIVLEGTEWNLRLTPSNPKDQTSVEFDKISFSNDQVISKKMAAKGFQPTNYTLTTQLDGTIFWETMQTGPNGERVFWRGEWKEDGMRGVLSQQEVGGELKTFQFVGSK